MVIYMDVNKIKDNLCEEIQKLILIIKKEYPEFVCLSDIYDLNKKVHIEETGTISLFVKNGEFYFPKDAFKVLAALKQIPGFGSFKEHKTYSKNNMIINDNTYLTYIKHVFLKGLTPEEYFKESLLHETFHFCGSGGGSAIREGINELKTRQLAEKYNLETSCCGYPKETKIAYELEKLFGKEVINMIAFSKDQMSLKRNLDAISKEMSDFYFKLESAMNNEFYNKYMKYDFPGLLGPLKKTKMYNSINYSHAYELINNYKNDQGLLNSLQNRPLK